MSLIDDIKINKNAIAEICPSLITSTNNNTGLPNINLDISLESIPLINYQKQYFDKVEEGNQYINELTYIEKKYFEEKYGPNIYKYLKNQRKDYYEKKKGNQSNNTDNWNKTSDQAKKTINREMNIYNNLKNPDLIKKKINVFKNNVDFIDEQGNKKTNMNELNKREIYYRNNNSQYISNLSVNITIIYYFILLCVFIYLFIDDILNLKKNIFLYIILIIFPFIYHYLYMLIIYLLNKINVAKNNEQPKNAFLDESKPLVFLDD